MRAVAVTLVVAFAIVPGQAMAQADFGVIAYSRDPDGPAGPAGPAIYVARLDGTGERRLTEGFAPNLAVGDTQFTYSLRRNGAVQIMRADLYQPAPATQVTTFANREDEFGPFRYGAMGSVWSPSRTRVAMRLTEGSTTTLAIVNADGSEFRRFEFGHLFGSPVAWRDEDSLAVGTDSGPRIVSNDGVIVNVTGAQQTDTPVVWAAPEILVVNDAGGVSALNVDTGERTRIVAGAQAYGQLASSEIVYATADALGAKVVGSPDARTLAPLPPGAQVRSVVTNVESPIVEIADASGTSSIYAVEGGALRKIADGAELSVSVTANLDGIVFGGPAATATAAPATPRPDAAAQQDPHAQGRTAFTTSVPSADEVDTGAKALLTSLLLTALLMLLLTFPAELFNSTLDKHYDEVRGWFRLEARAPVASQPRGRRLGTFAVFTLLAALLYGLLDPDFGFDAASLRLYAGLLVGMLVVTVVFGAAPVAYLRRKYGERGLLRALPGTLLVGVACVVISRLASFEPGYMYGLLGGFAFSRALSKEEEGRNALVSAAGVLVVAVLAWFLWQPVNDAAADGDPSLLLGLSDSTLATIAVGGIQGLVIGLIPLRSLQGHVLARWNRKAWAAVYGVALFLFVHLLLRNGGDETGAPFVTWLVLFAAFGAVSVAFWGYFRVRSSSG